MTTPTATRTDMKTAGISQHKLLVVTKAIREATAGGRGMTGYQVAELAEYLLRRAGGDLRAAGEAAKRPYVVSGRYIY